MGYSITPALLRAVGASAADAEVFAPLMDAARTVHGDDFNTITSRTGIAMLVAQTGVESAGFSTLSENLNYSVQALLTGGPAAYFNQVEAQKYGYVKDGKGGYSQLANQEMIANLYYGGRLGNLGVITGDGWMFRGSGLIENTGRSNHTRFGTTLGLTPEQAADYSRTPEGAVKVALWYWRANGLVLPASQGDVTVCTHLIQGGTGGLSDRLARFKAALAALG